MLCKVGKGARSASCQRPGGDPSPALMGRRLRAPGCTRPMLRGAARDAAGRSSPSLSWPISSDRQTQFLSPRQSPYAAEHTKRIHYPMGDRKEGLWGGGGLPAHNAHKWRAGPPLLCLGRKGRDPRRGPVNGSIVSEPSSPWASPAPCPPPPPPGSCRLSGAEPDPLLWVGKAAVLLCFWGRRIPLGATGDGGNGGWPKEPWKGWMAWSKGNGPKGVIRGCGGDGEG